MTNKELNRIVKTLQLVRNYDNKAAAPLYWKANESKRVN